MPLALQTKPELLEALARASTTPISHDELHRQKVSFVMSSFREGSPVTRDRVEAAVARQEGAKRG